MNNPHLPPRPRLNVPEITAWTTANLAARDAYAESTANPKCGRCGRRESAGHDCGDDNHDKRSNR